MRATSDQGPKGTRVGVGFSDEADSRAAGREAGALARERAGGGPVDLGLVFATARHDYAALRDGVQEALGAEALLVGGGAVGIVTHDALSYDGSEVGIAAWSLGGGAFADLFTAEGLPHNEEAVGRELGRMLAQAEGLGNGALLVFYDSVHHAEGIPRLHEAAPLLAGLAREMRRWPPTAGAGLLGDMQLRPTKQICGDRLLEHSAFALLLQRGGLRMDTALLHGCRPMGEAHTVTKAEGPVVLELDGRPALDRIGELLGPDTRWQDYPLSVILGVDRGDPHAPFREERIQNRLCHDVDPHRKGLVMFEADLVAGTQVRLMRRSTDLDYVGRCTRELLARASGRWPRFALYIDAASRAAAYGGGEGEEAAEVRRALGPDIPLLGFYGGVGLAPLAGAVRPLDGTGILCLFSEEA